MEEVAAANQLPQPEEIQAAQVVVRCTDFDATLEYFTRTLGFRIDRISPADSPREADLSGHGLALLLQRGPEDDNGTIRLVVDQPTGENRITAPNGTTIELVAADSPVAVPRGEQTLVISRLAHSPGFGTGRAGMGYRDLIPGRLGGRFIASHIRIADGGEVPDYAHFHKIRFQMIYCYKGWVRVVYEDQGDPFVMEPGDCVLQPPEIRHRVLESSVGLEVIEIGCPAEHDTYADHDITLPTGRLEPQRDFGGQRFVRHVAKEASWVPSRLEGFESRHIGIAQATDGLAGVRVLRPNGPASTEQMVHDAELLFYFVLEGSLDLTLDGDDERLTAGDSVVIPAGMPHSLGVQSTASALLEVSLPAVVPVR